MNNQNKEIETYSENNQDSGAEGRSEIPGGNPRKINLPNKLTIFRMVLVPVIMVFILIKSPGEQKNWIDTWSNIFAAALFFIAGLTDFVDGMLARRLNLVTDFGKFMDPLADKFMVLGAMLAITAADSFSDLKWLSVWVTAVLVLREFAVTSIRLVAKSSDGQVIAANFLAKVKTVLQIVCVMTILLEDMVISQNLGTPPRLFSYITMALMAIATVWSGVVYFKTYWKYLDPVK
ncbi:MAG: CDP-diacylglycerol--glycerol-3-phosphate 3-phosphatidyltransferase [Oscillospiraceae bacterium]|nr:CDP-diacylglycerol--glycerol-3-phosphate 3-phosphatidyltransferase [Oscillospiraceae bacterium]